MEENDMSDWKNYPIGTKVHAIGGGYWTRTWRGYKWNGGSTFPTPGGDWCKIELPVIRKFDDKGE